MSETNSTANLGGLPNELLAEVKAKLGQAWNDLTVADHELVTAITADAAAIYMQASLTREDTPEFTAIQREVDQINAQLRCIGIAKAADLQRAFWDGFRTVSFKLVDLAVTAAITA